jgi:hypothetical protein
LTPAKARLGDVLEDIGTKVARLVRSPAKIGWPAFQALNVASAIPTQRRWTKTKLTIAARADADDAKGTRGGLLDLKRRGLAVAPELAVADGALGFWQGDRAPAASAGSRAASAHPLGDAPYGAWLGCRVPFPTGGRSTAGAPRRVLSISRPRGPEAGRS